MCGKLKFDELSETAKKRVLENEVKALYEDGQISDMLRTAFEERLQNEGLPMEDIRWRLSWSQGDGVAFYGRVDLEEYIQAQKYEDLYGCLLPAITEGLLTISIYKDKDLHHYDHWNTMNVITDEFCKGDIEKTKELREDIARRVRIVSRELEKEGYEIITEETSDENITRNLNEEHRYHPNGELCPEWADGEPAHE